MIPKPTHSETVIVNKDGFRVFVAVLSYRKLSDGELRDASLEATKKFLGRRRLKKDEHLEVETLYGLSSDL